MPGDDPVGRDRRGAGDDDEVAGADDAASSRPRLLVRAARAVALDRAHQWRKWRRPVKTIATPASSAAATTSSSRIEPPGWMIAVTPRLDRRARGRRRTGRTRRRRAPRPAASRAAPSRPPGGPSRRGSSARRRCRPSRRSRASTIALDFTWRHTRQAKSRSRPLLLGRRPRRSRPPSPRGPRASMSRSWTSRPPVDLADLAARRAAGRGAPGPRGCRTFGFAPRISSASSS